MAKILVVEDEPEIREAIVEELAEEGHVTVEADNGLEGLERVIAELPDLVLSDITMPKMNGYQFYRAFKENHPEHADTPFIFLTALSDREDELKGLRLGVDDYITKPIDYDLLLARIDLGLRRHRALTRQGPSIAPSQDPPTLTPSAVASAGKVKDIVSGSDGPIPVGKFETISLEAIKAKVGEDWARISNRILTTARAAIDDQLGPRDACHVTASEDFVVCFADLSDDEVNAKVRRMSDAIWERLFGETEDEDLSEVEAEAYELLLEPDETREASATFEAIEGLIDKEKMAASQANQKNLKQIYEYEDLFALTLLGAKGAPSTIKMLSFEEQHADRIRQLFDARRYESSFLLDLQRLLFERLKAKTNLKRAFRDAAMLLPVHFAIIQDEATRLQFASLCAAFKRSIEADLIIEVIEAPNRIKTQRHLFEPLPAGQALQFLEIRRIAQLDGLSVKDLQQLGVTCLTMSYDNLTRHDAPSLGQLIQQLGKGGLEFCIKDIPEGKLPDAQRRQAHLYALKNA